MNPRSHHPRRTLNRSATGHRGADRLDGACRVDGADRRPWWMDVQGVGVVCVCGVGEGEGEGTRRTHLAPVSGDTAPEDWAGMYYREDFVVT